MYALTQKCSVLPSTRGAATRPATRSSSPAARAQRVLVGAAQQERDRVARELCAGGEAVVGTADGVKFTGSMLKVLGEIISTRPPLWT